MPGHDEWMEAMELERRNFVRDVAEDAEYHLDIVRGDRPMGNPTSALRLVPGQNGHWDVEVVVGDDHHVVAGVCIREGGQDAEYAVLHPGGRRPRGVASIKEVQEYLQLLGLDPALLLERARKKGYQQT